MRPAASLWLVLALLSAGCGGGSLSGQEQVSFATVDTDPDWSPDGQLIAFQDRGVCVLGFGRRPKCVLRGNGFSLPAWSPNGRELAVVRDEADLSTAIYVVSSDGKKLRRLLRPPLPRSDPRWSSLGASETEPAWSPDGRRIAFQAGEGHIVVVSLADGRRHELATGYEPAWSPDGLHIAFSVDDALWIVAADGSDKPRRVAAEGGDPSWAPHSDRLVFEVLHHRGRYLRKAESLSLVGATGHDVEKLTFGGSSNDDPGWRGDLAPVP